MKEFGVLIGTQEIIPPIGGVYKYGATIKLIEVGVGQVNADFGEIHGKTKKEVLDKAKIAVDKWFVNNKKGEHYEISF